MMKKADVIYCFLLIWQSFVQGAAADDRTETFLKEFESYAIKAQKDWEIPGMAIGIVKDGKIVLAKGYGKRGQTDTRPVDASTVFQIGSLSKAFTSALVAYGVDKGWIKWEDYVKDRLPTFRLFDPWATANFQIVDLLAQRSGLPPYAGDTQSFLGYTRDDMINNLQYLKPATSFRSEYAYQNIFFVVAAQILSLKTNQSFSDLLKEILLRPLQMNQTTSTLGDYLKAENRAEWLMRLKNGEISHLKEDYLERDWNYILDAAGGLNSTAQDLCKWLIFQINQGMYEGQQVISKENMQRTTRSMIYASHINDHPMYYALGWVNLSYSPYPIIWHDGSTLGVYNVAAFIPEEKIGIVILTNVRNTNLAFALALQFFDSYFGKLNRDWSQIMLAKSRERATGEKESPLTNVTPPKSLSAYAGTYTNPIYPEVIVRENGGSLELTIGKSKRTFLMKPWNGDVFNMKWICGEESPTKVIFSQGADGKINHMQIELLAKEGCGDFEKI